MPGLSFDRVAEHYDASRGGTERGGRFADAIAPWIRGPQVVELGIGTGVIAAGLLRHDVRAVGVDLSVAMMRSAVERVGPVVAGADVEQLPIPADAVDTAYLVWVLHLVDDPVATLAEAARVVRPGGRVVVVGNDADDHPADEIGSILQGLHPLRRPGRTAGSIVGSAPAPLELVHRGFTEWHDFRATAAEQIALVEQRSFSTLFDVDDASWAAVVEPVLARLRGLPTPDRPRIRRNRHPLLVWEIGDHAPTDGVTTA